MTLIDLGAIAEARVALAALERRAEDLRQPAQWWAVWFFRAFLALVTGEFDRAEQLIALEMRPGLPANSAHDDLSVHAMHTFLLRREQGRLAETEQVTRTAIERCPWYPVHRAALVCTLHHLGRQTEARAVFDDLAADDFGALHRDSEWLLGIALTGEACAILGDRDRARTLYQQILPFERRHAHVIGEGSVGAMDRYLGLLARTMGQLEAAERHLRVAIEMNERMGARPWTAHTRCDLAEVLLEGDGSGDRERAVQELRIAGELCQQIGMIALSGRVARRLGELGVERMLEAEPPPGIAPSVFRQEGEYWTVAFSGDAFRLKDSKGLAVPGEAAGRTQPGLPRAGPRRSRDHGDAQVRGDRRDSVPS
jgi:tetratricopeptide (TPR) repeat protein